MLFIRLQNHLRLFKNMQASDANGVPANANRTKLQITIAREILPQFLLQWNTLLLKMNHPSPTTSCQSVHVDHFVHGNIWPISNQVQTHGVCSYKLPLLHIVYPSQHHTTHNLVYRIFNSELQKQLQSTNMLQTLQLLVTEVQIQSSHIARLTLPLRNSSSLTHCLLNAPWIFFYHGIPEFKATSSQHVLTCSPGQNSCFCPPHSSLSGIPWNKWLMQGRPAGL